MSDSDTFLDSILDGVIATDAPVSTPGTPSSPDQQNPSSDQKKKGRPASVPATSEAVPEASDTSDEPRPPLTGLDALLEGMTSMSDPNATTIPVAPSQPQSEGGQPSEPAQSRYTDNRHNVETAVAGAVQPDTTTRPEAEVAAQSAGLPLAAPHDILGLPGQPDVSASHIELAHEINDIAAQSRAETPLPAVSSFASIAQEIAATVEAKPSTPRPNASVENAKEADRSSVYIRTRGHRRRRVNRTTRIAVTQVFAIVLLLVVGLAAEYEYVARGHNASTTAAPLVTSLPVPRFSVVAQTPVKGYLFHFATSGSAQSAAFRVESRFTVAVSARCSVATKSAAVDVVLQSSGRQAANIFVDADGAGTHLKRSAMLGPGTYLVSAHTSGVCAWSAAGIAGR